VPQAPQGDWRVPKRTMRRRYGQEANRVKEALNREHEQRGPAFKESALEASLKKGRAAGVTLRAARCRAAELHVATQGMRKDLFFFFFLFLLFFFFFFFFFYVMPPSSRPRLPGISQAGRSRTT